MNSRLTEMLQMIKVQSGFSVSDSIQTFLMGDDFQPTFDAWKANVEKESGGQLCITHQDLLLDGKVILIRYQMRVPTKAEKTALSCFFSDELKRTEALPEYGSRHRMFFLGEQGKPVCKRRYTGQNNLLVPMLNLTESDLEQAAWDLLLMAAKDREARSGVTKEFTNSCPIRGVGQRWSIVEKMGIQMLVSDDTMMAVHPYRGDMHGLYVQDSGKTLLLDPITAFGGEEELARAYFEENFKVLNFCEKLTEGHPRRLPEVLKKAWDRDELKLRTYYQDYVRNVMGNGPPEHKPA